MINWVAMPAAACKRSGPTKGREEVRLGLGPKNWSQEFSYSKCSLRMQTEPRPWPWLWLRLWLSPILYIPFHTFPLAHASLNLNWCSRTKKMQRTLFRRSHAFKTCDHEFFKSGFARFIATSCRAVVLPRFGGPEMLQLRSDVEVPQLKPSEVLVRARAVSVNPLDTRVSYCFSSFFLSFFN